MSILRQFSYLAVLACAVALAGCGDKVTTYSCQPACPSGASCGPNGCVLPAPPDSGDQPAVDLAAPACQPDCAAPTPFCNASHLCVPCLMDSHCPSGMQCKQTGAITACVTGCTSDQGCVGLGASMKCCDGQCSDTTADPANCGGCGMACTAANARPVCTAGACQGGTCNAGWGDCNGDSSDGCEANLAIDPGNCGACSQSCRFDHAQSACSTTCYIAACDFGWADCDTESSTGCETSVLADLKNCGGCGVSCTNPPHAVSTCANATCQLASCAPGFSDCDGLVANGCETVSGTDKNNCGQCGNVCGNEQICVHSACTCKSCNIPNAKTRCINLQCVFVACADGFGDCNNDLKDGCETDLTADASNCGACNNACDKNAGSCVGGACVPCGNDCWGPQGCLTGAGHCIQFTCRPGNGGPMFCDGCKGWQEITYDQWQNQGYCADVTATYRISDGTHTKCGMNGPGCCGDSNSCAGGDNAWHFWDVARGANYAVGPALGNMADKNCRTWDFNDNSNYTRITACQLF